MQRKETSDFGNSTSINQARRLVRRRGGGGGGGGGVRESNKVELIKSGGGSRRGRSPSGSGAEPQPLCNFCNFSATKHSIIA